jgi:hypothetical protein
MNKLTSTVGPHRESVAILGRTPSHLPRWRRAPIMKIVSVLTVVIAAAFVSDAILTSKFAVDAMIKSNAEESGATHIVLDGLLVAIPNKLAHIAIEDAIALP